MAATAASRRRFQFRSRIAFHRDTGQQYTIIDISSRQSDMSMACSPAQYSAIPVPCKQMASHDVERLSAATARHASPQPSPRHHTAHQLLAPLQPAPRLTAGVSPRAHPAAAHPATPAPHTAGSVSSLPGVGGGHHRGGDDGGGVGDLPLGRLKDVYIEATTLDREIRMMRKHIDPKSRQELTRIIDFCRGRLGQAGQRSAADGVGVGAELSKPAGGLPTPCGVAAAGLKYRPSLLRPPSTVRAASGDASSKPMTRQQSALY